MITVKITEERMAEVMTIGDEIDMMEGIFSTKIKVLSKFVLNPLTELYEDDPDKAYELIRQVPMSKQAEIIERFGVALKNLVPQTKGGA